MKIVITLFAVFFCCILMVAQPVAPGAEATAMGGSFVTQQSVFSSRHNVAGLAFLEKNTLAFGVRNNFLANNLNDFYLLSNFKIGHGVLGIDFLNYGFDAYQQNEVGLSFAQKLNENWSLGARLHYAHNNILAESVSRYLFAADLGILGKIENWRFGVSLQNLLQSKWQGRVEEREPSVFRLGAGYYFEGETTLTAEFYKANNAAPDIRLGFNYAPIPALDLRFGFATLQPSVSFGVGLSLKNFQFNFAAAWHQQLGLSPVSDLIYAW